MDLWKMLCILSASSSACCGAGGGWGQEAVGGWGRQPGGGVEGICWGTRVLLPPPLPMWAPQPVYFAPRYGEGGFYPGDDCCRWLGGGGGGRPPPWPPALSLARLHEDLVPADEGPEAGQQTGEGASERGSTTEGQADSLLRTAIGSAKKKKKKLGKEELPPLPAPFSATLPDFSDTGRTKSSGCRWGRRSTACPSSSTKRSGCVWRLGAGSSGVVDMNQMDLPTVESEKEPRSTCRMGLDRSLDLSDFFDGPLTTLPPGKWTWRWGPPTPPVPPPAPCKPTQEDELQEDAQASLIKAQTTPTDEGAELNEPERTTTNVRFPFGRSSNVFTTSTSKPDPELALGGFHGSARAPWGSGKQILRVVSEVLRAALGGEGGDWSSETPLDTAGRRKGLAPPGGLARGAGLVVCPSCRRLFSLLPLAPPAPTHPPSPADKETLERSLCTLARLFKMER